MLIASKRMMGKQINEYITNRVQKLLPNQLISAIEVAPEI